MRIHKLKIQNYKGYSDSETVHFESGFNVIVGQNNAGKTALLEAATFRIVGKPHRSLKTLPARDTYLNPQTSVDGTFLVSGAELRRFFIESGTAIRIPIRGLTRDQNDDPSKARAYLEEIFAADDIDINFKLAAENSNSSSLQVSIGPSIRLYDDMDDRVLFGQFAPNQDRSSFSYSGVHGPGDTGYWSRILNALVSQIYCFRAERLNLSRAGFGNGSVLRPDAGNLPEVLNHLQNTNPARFNRFNEYVHKIFPSIFRITVSPAENSQLEIMVWSVDPETERNDLAVPLSESGTGIGQVLAILYVVITSAFPRTIIIDEPNSFLHPGASRKLIEILRGDFPNHQYIVSTHSSEIIRSADPASLTLVRWLDSGSVIEQLDMTSLHNLQATLTEIGVKLSDVFGADKVLWVEGTTEELCFPLILNRLISPAVLNTSVIGVVNTGDFESKKLPLKRIMDVYMRFTKGNALMPPTVAFVFDKEARTDAEITELTRQGGGRMNFIPRRMFENYLLDEVAIHAVMLRNASATGTAFTAEPENIIDWITANGSEKKYFSRGASLPVTDPNWARDIDGANLLKDLFAHYFGSAISFAKTTHSTELCEWLVTHKPDELNELASFLAGILAAK